MRWSLVAAAVMLALVIPFLSAQEMGTGGAVETVPGLEPAADVLDNLDWQAQLVKLFYDNLEFKILYDEEKKRQGEVEQIVASQKEDIRALMLEVRRLTAAVYWLRIGLVLASAAAVFCFAMAYIYSNRHWGE